MILETLVGMLKLRHGASIIAMLIAVCCSGSMSAAPEKTISSPMGPLGYARPGFLPSSNKIVYAVTPDRRLVTFELSTGRELRSLKLPVAMSIDEMSSSPSGEIFAIVADCRMLLASWSGVTSVHGDKKSCVQGLPIWRKPGVVLFWASVESKGSARTIEFLELDVSANQLTRVSGIPANFFPRAQLGDGTLIGDYTLSRDSGENLGLARIAMLRRGARNWTPLFPWGESTGYLDHHLIPASSDGTLIVAARVTDSPIDIDLMLIKRGRAKPDMCWNLPNESGLPRALPNLSSDGAVLIYLEAADRANAARSAHEWKLRIHRLAGNSTAQWKECPQSLTRFREDGSIR